MCVQRRIVHVCMCVCLCMCEYVWVYVRFARVRACLYYERVCSSLGSE